MSEDNDHRTTSTERLSHTWLLIMDRLKVDDLPAWLAAYRRGDRTSNPQWSSWEAIARMISQETRVAVTANGVRARWSDEVDTLLAQSQSDPTGAQLPDVPTRDQSVGSTGPAGVSGSNTPAGSNQRGEATP